MSYLDAQCEPVPTVSGYEVGRYGMYEIPDVTAIARAIVSRRRPAGPVVRSWLRGDKALFWWTDPMPALGGLGQSVARKLGRATSGLRRRGETGVDTPDTANRALSAR
jgi:hypothetical protein